MNRLKFARFITNKSQIQLFKETGIWPSRISYIENDHLVATKTEKQKLAIALDWEIKLLFPEDDNSPIVNSE